MNRYKQHQNQLKKNSLAVQQRYRKHVRIFDRHVGKFLPLAFIKGVIQGKWKINDWSKFLLSINKKGMADQYMLVRTEFGLLHIEIETKTGKAVQSPEQKDWQAFIESMGGIYILARKPEDILNVLEGLIYEPSNV